MSGLEVLLVVGIIGFVIYQQLAGQPLQGRPVAVPPAVVTVIGFMDLRGHHMGPPDIAWLTVGAAGSLAIGLAFGLIMRLESLGQAAVIVPRAMRAGIPFAPDRSSRGGRARDAAGRY